jgi:hypothetical protein
VQQQLSRSPARDVIGVAGHTSRHTRPTAPATGASHALGGAGRRALSHAAQTPSWLFSRNHPAAACPASHTAVSEAEEDAVDEALCAAPMLAPATSTATSTSRLGRCTPLTARIALARGVARERRSLPSGRESVGAKNAHMVAGRGCGARERQWDFRSPFRGERGLFCV